MTVDCGYKNSIYL